MVMNKVGKDIPKYMLTNTVFLKGIGAYRYVSRSKSYRYPPFVQEIPNFLAVFARRSKRTGLKDGMTISFHHHFREGDYVMNMVLEEIAGLGIKNISIAPSSIANVHAPLIDHIKMAL